MRPGLWVCSVVLWLAGGAASADTAYDGVTLEVELDPSQARLEGRFEADPARIDPASLRRFRLDPGIAVDAVTLGGQVVEFDRSEDGWLELAREPGADDGPLAIRYGARLSAPDQARPGSGYLGPDGGYLPPGADWYPRRPDAEPHAVRIELKSLGGHLGVASGSRVAEERRGDEYHATFEHPAGRALAIATGPWEPAELRVGDVEVRTLFPVGLEERFGETYREQAAKYLQRFNDEIGPYPFATFTIAASPQPVGLAFSGFTLLGERVIPLPFIPHTSLGHEVLHAWWGTGVYVDYSAGNWSEGLTTYMADYQFKRDRGEGRDERGQWLRDYAALPAGEDRAHGSFRGGNSGAARIAGYHRGAMLWRMLEDRIGREALLSGARTLYDEWRFREADWDAVIGAFDGTTDEDLRPFFSQWVERAGAPALELTGLRREARGDGWRVQGRLQQRDEQAPWELYVPLELETENGRETHWVELNAVEKGISLETSSRPLAIAIDPDWRMFRHLAADESPAILRQGALDPEARVVALEDAEPSEVAPWLGRVPGSAHDAEGMRIVLGSHSSVAGWLGRHDLPSDPVALANAGEIGPGARAWAVPDTRLVVISGADAGTRREVLAALRHRSHYSYLLPGANGEWQTGLWSQPGIWQEFDDDE
ncbi:aminopeptidase N [Thioalkalivibrio versutus]|uniref:Aminopeptidase N n=1 Tax=Thioalkalivibrio versutus TaxID=106634 RepID=A0A0G3G3B2_9GAMM|nr:M1 family peptidase [Thioalkalivibrio versutus]AKJ94899.1 aminopeptidase N [Thioalkalivibrio versutus]